MTVTLMSPLTLNNVTNVYVEDSDTVSEPNMIMQYKNRSVKIVVTDHWARTLLNTMDDHQRNQLIRYANDVDEFICVSEPSKQAVQNITGVNRNIFVIPNVVSNIFKPMMVKSDNHNFRFVAIGRLVPTKHFDAIIKAFALKFKDCNNITLTIIGGGKIKHDLQKLCKTLGVSQKVEFTDTLSRENVAKRLGISNCLICFSRMETFGVPVIEAWACGIPAIGTDSLGFLEYYNNSLGYIVSHNNIEELASSMEKVVKNKDN